MDIFGLEHGVASHEIINLFHDNHPPGPRLYSIIQPPCGKVPLLSDADDQIAEFGKPRLGMDDVSVLDVLPSDFDTRLEEVDTFGNLRVRRLGRLDLR